MERILLRQGSCLVHDIVHFGKYVLHTSFCNKSNALSTLKPFGIAGECRSERIGIWVNTEQGEQKIASLGIRIRKWISYHGIAININPDLKHFNGIVPCGLSNYKMTSFENLGIITNKNELDNILKSNFSKHFSASEKFFLLKFSIPFWNKTSDFSCIKIFNYSLAIF